jgi:hypothetical protein
MSEKKKDCSMLTEVFNEIIEKNNGNTYFSQFEKLFFKKLKKAWDDYDNPHSAVPKYPLSERLIECFNEAKEEVKELKKRRSYALEN